MTIQPLNDNIFIKPILEEKTSGGIIIVKNPNARIAHAEPLRAKVLAIGPGKMTRKGVRVPNDFNVGDTVIYNNHDVYNKVFHDNEELSVIRSNHIIAVVET